MWKNPGGELGVRLFIPQIKMADGALSQGLLSFPEGEQAKLILAIVIIIIIILWIRKK